MVSDQHYRWLVVLFSLVIQAVSLGILAYCFTLFALPWLDEFGGSRRDVMITIACLQIGMGVLGPLVGRALDRFRVRNIVVMGASALGAGLWLTQHVTELWHLWLLYATVMPLAMAMTGTLAAQTLVAKWFTDKRGLALGISAMGTNLGGVVFPLLVAGWLIDVGWRQTFGRLAVVSVLLIVPLALWVLRREPPQVGLLAGEGTAAIGQRRLWSAKEILTTSLFWLPFLALVPLNVAFGALQFNIGNFVRDVGLADDAAAELVTVGSLCMIAGKLFFGSLGDRWDHRVLFWVANGLMSLSIVGFLVATGYSSLMLAAGCLGLAGGGILPLMGLIFGARFGAASFGRVMGFVMLNVVFGAIAPVAAGWVYDVTGSFDISLWVMLALVLPAVIAMVRLPRVS
jgi:MFS family permease